MLVRTHQPVALVPAADRNREPRLPSVLVLHYTYCSLEEAFERYQQGAVSAHYTVDRNGDLYQHVDELEAAHHAGVSHWRRARVNYNSIGIEIVNAGPVGPCEAFTGQPERFHCAGGLAWEAFAEDEVQRVIALSQEVLSRYPIDRFDVVGHSDVAPSRKEDPGPAFPWLRLARAGIGVAYDPELKALIHGEEQFAVTPVALPATLELQQRLSALGYGVPTHGVLDQVTSRVLLAFNSRYLGRFDGSLTDETAAIVDALVRWPQQRQAQLVTGELYQRRLRESASELDRIRDGTNPGSQQ